MIPSWNVTGVLPPIRPGYPGHSPKRSPYRVSLSDFVDQFSFSPERIQILQGLLAFRKELHQVGIISGFQWLDGSFLEQIEVLELRPPQDIDTVTYFDLPVGDTESSLFGRAGNLFDNNHVKLNYRVDHYPVVMGKPLNASQIQQINYWYSMWSHRRDGIWKGFVEVSLDPAEDSNALNSLATKLAGGGTT